MCYYHKTCFQFQSLFLCFQPPKCCSKTVLIKAPQLPKPQIKSQIYISLSSKKPVIVFVLCILILFQVLKKLTKDFKADGSLREKRVCIACPSNHLTVDGLFCYPQPQEWVINANLISCASGFAFKGGKFVKNVQIQSLKKYSIENAKRVIYNFFNSRFTLEESLLEDSVYISGRLTRSLLLFGRKLSFAPK